MRGPRTLDVSWHKTVLKVFLSKNSKKSFAFIKFASILLKGVPQLLLGARIRTYDEYPY